MIPQPLSPARTAPLSPAQQRLWFLERMDPGEPVCSIPYATRLLDRDALARALQAPPPSAGPAWRARGGLEVHEIPGCHGAIVYEPRAGGLAKKLAECLAAFEPQETASAPAAPRAPRLPHPIPPKADAAFNEAAR